MGVTGLLRYIQPQTTQQAVSHFAGKTLGVDGYAWLHRAAVSCAEELLRGLPTTRLVQSIDTLVQLYGEHGINLYFVFDGAHIAVKSRVEEQRRAQREAARALYTLNADRAKGVQSLNITPMHAATVMAYLKARNIPYIVAPYEADAQLVYLEKHGHIDAVLSEDSDLIIFGAKTLVTKANARADTCSVVYSKNLPAPLNTPAGRRAVAILAGCDYSKGVHQLGPVKTSALVKKHGSLSDILSILLKQDRIDAQFITTATNADLAFQFQRVWDPKKCTVTYLNEPNVELPDEVAGKLNPRPIAHRIACGLLDPNAPDKPLIVPSCVSEYLIGATPFVPRKTADASIEKRLGSPGSGLASPFFASFQSTIISSLESTGILFQSTSTSSSTSSSTSTSSVPVESDTEPEPEQEVKVESEEHIPETPPRMERRPLATLFDRTKPVKFMKPGLDLERFAYKPVH